MKLIEQSRLDPKLTSLNPTLKPSQPFKIEQDDEHEDKPEDKQVS